MIEDLDDYEVRQLDASDHELFDGSGNIVTSYHFMQRSLNGKFDWEVT